MGNFIKFVDIGLNMVNRNELGRESLRIIKDLEARVLTDFEKNKIDDGFLFASNISSEESSIYKKYKKKFEHVVVYEEAYDRFGNKLNGFNSVYIKAEDKELSEILEVFIFQQTIRDIHGKVYSICANMRIEFSRNGSADYTLINPPNKKR